jgi:hypothetical protein
VKAGDLIYSVPWPVGGPANSYWSGLAVVLEASPDNPVITIWFKDRKEVSRKVFWEVINESR